MMRQPISLATRNLWKQKRRSFVTLLAIAIGFTAINLFAGYIANVYRGIQLNAIHHEGLGHLTIARAGFFEAGGMNPKKYLLDQPTLQKILHASRTEPGVLLATPRLAVSGLASNGKVSTIFIGMGEVPADRELIHHGPGQTVTPQANTGTVAEGLATNLEIKAGDSLTLLAATVDGQTNALDLTADRIVNTGIVETNDKLLQLSLDFTRQLLDTDGADRVTLLLANTADTARIQAALAARFQAQGLSLEIKTWQDLSNSYKPVKAMFDTIFLFISLIVLVIVLMSIINTMSATVMERVREIGTLRAIGMDRAGIRRLFSIEGSMLGILGCLVGAMVTTGLTLAINHAHLTYVPPGYVQPVPFTVMLLPNTQLAAGLVLALIAMIAAFFPAMKAARLEIVDALGHI
ncbi:putative ABC transport system permease protein [Chitinivorax tropicus]|uniref:Putative ABC transport system permease protein n=1 Tax=Chitinivorax tropicus TaxID=714531 RepID=A0A840MMH3_9PROT|nr:FtsX-like permease family protein [Chitinivorax tropicus]MBB5017403.1 putative ABC transport system permease protein [Chitinivorax tropicus]